MNDKQRFNADGYYYLQWILGIVGVVAFVYWVNDPTPYTSHWDQALAIVIWVGCFIAFCSLKIKTNSKP